MNQGSIQMHEVTVEEVRACVFAPRADDHKYRRGTVLLATGSERFPGAALLAADAATRSGAGMVRYLGPALLASEVVRSCPEVVVDTPAEQGTRRQPDAVVMGSGIPDIRDDPRLRAARRVLTDQAMHGLQPVAACIADSGALGLVAELVNRGSRLGKVLLTPHAAELAKMLGAVKGTAFAVEQIEADRPQAAWRLAARTGSIVLLKGRETLVAEPDGLVRRVTAPTSWLATAGSGDVLAGIAGAIAAIAARREPEERPSLPEIAAAAAWLHGRAAWLAAMRPLGEVLARDALLPEAELTAGAPGGPVTARDITREVPAVMAALLALPETKR